MSLENELAYERDIRELREENALLRSVLKRIAGDGCGMATKPDEPCHKLYVREDDWCWCCIARQALAREEK